MAASRPAPGPLTSTSVDLMPCSIAFRAAASAAIWAANGVDFLEPLKPRLPAEAQEMTPPWGSLIETIVLLNEAWTCATPVWTFFTSRLRRDLVCFLAAKNLSVLRPSTTALRASAQDDRMLGRWNSAPEGAKRVSYRKSQSVVNKNRGPGLAAEPPHV